ncbi:MAG: IS110 family transposase [Erysipelotrichaceae bacterium]|nr:IS110 family transposase [Erysipelotrichaceae bacterium]
MYVIGVDAAKGKSTVCVISLDGEVLLEPRDISHSSDEFQSLKKKLKDLIGQRKDAKVVMEATGVYHWPIYKFFKDEGYQVSIINPLKMKLFARDHNFRGVKTDKIDSRLIALYGSEKWSSLIPYITKEDDRRDKLKRLSRAYSSYQKSRVLLQQNLDLELEKNMPGIKKILTDDEKLFDFCECFAHFDNINKLSEKLFLEKFSRWAKKKNHRFRHHTPDKIYELAKSAIPTVPCDDISTLTLESAINALRTINEGLNNILARMHELSADLPEYEIAMKMPGTGYVLAPLIIAEIGDIRLYHNKKSLVSTCGIDVPPYESGQFKAGKRTITKKGNKHLRRHLYLVTDSIWRVKPKQDTAILDFMTRKKEEHKLDKQVKVAGMRKYLHIYYARVKEKYKGLGIWQEAD